MKKFFAVFLFLFVLETSAQELHAIFKNNQSVDYWNLIAAYKKIDAHSDQMKLIEYEKTDAGFPLHLLVINKKKDFSKPAKKAKNHSTFLIMNGIHPGESEGIDASLLLAQEMAYGKLAIPENVTICIMPVYNVDGMLNRKKHTRVNQNGPEEKGARGNARGYDLNRDFIKADTKNTFAFYKIFHNWKPEVFLDNHTSNGADYQYTITLIATQRQKLGGKTAELLSKKMLPDLYSQMKRKNFEMIPYVNLFGKSPDENGYEEFLETPKYSTGYTALFGTIGFVAETHMLKPYPSRVEATHELMKCIINFIENNTSSIREAKTNDELNYKIATDYETNFKLDTTQFSKIIFNGYEAQKIPSQLGNYKRTFYNREKPFSKEINYYNYYTSKLKIVLPKYYVISKGWLTVIERLKANQIEMKKFEKDTSFDVSVQYITHYDCSSKPYEAHHPNYSIQTEKQTMNIKFLKGDYLIPTNQIGSRYLAETLEPKSEDGFFAWNFFDNILHAKEGFSDYVFEDDALKIINENNDLKLKFENWKINNPTKANNSYEVLNFIFKNATYKDVEHNRIPVFRID